MEAVHLAAADPAAQAAPTGARHAVAALSAGLACLQGPRTPLKPRARPQIPPKTSRISARFQPWCAGMRGSGPGLTGSRAAQGTLPTGLCGGRAPSPPRAGPVGARNRSTIIKLNNRSTKINQVPVRIPGRPTQVRFSLSRRHVDCARRGLAPAARQVAVPGVGPGVTLAGASVRPLASRRGVRAIGRGETVAAACCQCCSAPCRPAPSARHPRRRRLAARCL